MTKNYKKTAKQVMLDIASGKYKPLACSRRAPTLLNPSFGNNNNKRNNNNYRKKEDTCCCQVNIKRYHQSW